MQNKATAPQMKKYGFFRTPSEDFSDDGTRFTMYEYRGLQVSYAYWNGEHYMSLRPDYTPDLTHEVYSKFPGYQKANEFNGTGTLDLGKLSQNAEALVTDINRWVEDPTYCQEAKPEERDVQLTLSPIQARALRAALTWVSMLEAEGKVEVYDYQTEAFSEISRQIA